MASCKKEQKDNESSISTAYIVSKQRGFWSLTVLLGTITPRSHETVKLQMKTILKVCYSILYHHKAVSYNFVLLFLID